MILFDIETAPLLDAAAYIEAGEPPANYKQPEAIAKWRAEDQARQLQRAALDPDLCRIVAICFKRPNEDEFLWLPRDAAHEAAHVEMFWRRLPRDLPVVGFGCLHFDLPVLYRRSLYLGVTPVQLERDKYRHDDVIDLADILSEQGRLRLRSLDFYCSRFGIDIPAAGDGADVPGWVAAGQWDQVEAHVRADVLRTEALARRMGVLV